LSKNDDKVIMTPMFQRLRATTLMVVVLALGFLTACQTATVTPTAKMKPALAERMAALNTEEPMPPAEGPEDVAPGPAQDPTRNPGLVPSPLLRYSAASATP
jgi:hypothetical protein